MEKNISKKIFENAQKFGSTISKFSDWTNPTPSTDVTFPRASLLISPYRSYFYSVSSNVFRQRSFPGERKKRYGTADKMERERERAAHERRQAGSALLETLVGTGPKIIHPWHRSSLGRNFITEMRGAAHPLHSSNLFSILLPLANDRFSPIDRFLPGINSRTPTSIERNEWFISASPLEFQSVLSAVIGSQRYPPPSSVAAVYETNSRLDQLGETSSGQVYIVFSCKISENWKIFENILTRKNACRKIDSQFLYRYFSNNDNNKFY